MSSLFVVIDINYSEDVLHNRPTELIFCWAVVAYFTNLVRDKAYSTDIEYTEYEQNIGG